MGLSLLLCQFRRPGHCWTLEALELSLPSVWGADDCIPHSCCCSGWMDNRSLHCLSCNYGAGRFPRHSAMKDVINRALQNSSLPSVLERFGLQCLPSCLVVVEIWFEFTRVLILLLWHTHQLEPITVETM